MNDDPYAVTNFEAFWPHYVRLHQRPETETWHAVATLASVSLIGAALVQKSWLLLLLAPLANHVIAQSSHRLVEKNKSTPWRNPLWHTRAEFRMLRLVLSGRMAREVECHAPTVVSGE